MSEMCKAMEELRVESRKEMAVEMAQSLYEQGVSIEQIANYENMVRWRFCLKKLLCSLIAGKIGADVRIRMNVGA